MLELRQPRLLVVPTALPGLELCELRQDEPFKDPGHALEVGSDVDIGVGNLNKQRKKKKKMPEAYAGTSKLKHEH